MLINWTTTKMAGMDSFNDITPQMLSEIEDECKNS